MKTLSALGRFLAMAGLFVLLVVMIPLAWIVDRLNGGTLTVAEWAADKFEELRAVRS